ncbi:ribosomal protein S18-alanine N-acetyltransferase [Streptomyces sp. ACA25]|uniref:ribosomal protein S18-alanine N-acetyltransferase n=1 Tax=Streptomyces sp. ACA25 TaxID=3022596 RepID=UPI0023077060|nr:ribosomal protein S18-alanine N-acetyltransferase [Streptomyces sp. ACA25]MDB1087418.1 ribosomal protein S18-alanine N-acetyltransferase [Streptomyces sp. ACA25]
MRWWDIEPVLALERLLFPEDAWSAGMFWSELAHARGPGRTRHFVVAERAGAEAGRADPTGTDGPAEPGGSPLAGYAGLAVAGDAADVQTLAVAPEHEGTGLGTRLLTELLSAATGFGSREVFLEVRVDNARAQRLYTRFGFEPVGVRRGYYQPGNHDALVMRRDHTRPASAGPASAQETENHG